MDFIDNILNERIVSDMTVENVIEKIAESLNIYLEDISKIFIDTLVSKEFVECRYIGSVLE